MGVRVLGVGLGLFLVLLLWVVALVLCLVFWKSKGAAGYSGLGFSLAASLITVILVAIPKSPEGQAEITETKVYDDLFIGRIVLLVISGSFALLTLGLTLASHLASPVSAVTVKKIK